VAELLRVQVETRRGIPVAGSTHWTGGAWLIMVNADDAPTRQRFTIGHELKHVIDHPIVNIAYPAIGDLSSEERQEDLCDYFSACVLMPRRWLKHYWGLGYQRTDELARMFGVSRAAMRYRLIDIGLLDPSVRRRHYFRALPLAGTQPQEALIA